MQQVPPPTPPGVPFTNPLGAASAVRDLIGHSRSDPHPRSRVDAPWPRTQTIAIRLDIPAQSRAGAYVGTLTTTIYAAP